MKDNSSAPSGSIRYETLYGSFSAAAASTLTLSWWTPNLMVEFVLLAVGTGLLMGLFALRFRRYDVMAAMSGATAGGIVGALLIMALAVAGSHPMHSHQGMMIMGDTMAQMAGASLGGWFVPETML